MLGLFSEDVENNMKPKIPAGERAWVRNIRLTITWAPLNPERGVYDWSTLDAKINQCLSVGINSILLTITGPCPRWAVNPYNPGDRKMGPPKDMNDWGAFCGALAARYRDYVDYYQLWLEPGWDIDSGIGQVYYSGQCEWSYMGLARAGFEAIHANDPTAYVICGSLMNGLTREYKSFVNYDTLLAGRNQDISMKIESNREIVAERPMYFIYHDWCPGGTVELGTREARTTWYLAEGATHPGFEEWICIQNPGEKNTKVTITYMFPGGATQEQVVSVPKHSRCTVDVNLAVGPYRDVSARLVSTNPIIVERPMYFNYHGWGQGGSIESGVAELSNTWFLAEGATQPGFEEWISLMNPNPWHTTVTITYMFPGGATKKQTVKMPGTSRETVMVNDVVGPNKDVSAMIESTQPIIAERPMYFVYHGAWPGGHCQVGSTRSGTSWFLSEGTTRNNQYDGAFEEWISIQNPGDSPTHVDLTYMFPGGLTRKGNLTIAPHARETVLVNDEVGPDKDVSVQLESDRPIDRKSVV